MPTEDALEIALLVAEAIERAGGEYFVGGSVASSLQGEPRATNDIDFVVSMTRVRAFADALGPDFEVDQQMALATAARTASRLPARIAPRPLGVRSRACRAPTL